LAQGVARLGESWFFLTDLGRDELELWRAELGVAKRIASFPRLDRRRYGVAPRVRLVRRAVGRDIGLLVTVPGDPSAGGASGSWVVLPVDPASGQLAEPVVLGPGDLGGRLPRRCSSEQDGWLVDGPVDTSVVVRLTGHSSYLDSIELRLRLSPGDACVEAMAARTGRELSRADTGRRTGRTSRGDPAPPAGAVPLAVRSQSGPARWALWCEPSDRTPESRVERLLR
jgi:hypothetical protein